MERKESVPQADRTLERDLHWVLEAFAPLRFPLAQGLWLLRPWLGSERIARWAADLEAPPHPSGERGDPS